MLPAVTCGPGIHSCLCSSQPWFHILSDNSRIVLEGCKKETGFQRTPLVGAPLGEKWCWKNRLLHSLPAFRFQSPQCSSKRGLLSLPRASEFPRDALGRSGLCCRRPLHSHRETGGQAQSWSFGWASLGSVDWYLYCPPWCREAMALSPTIEPANASKHHSRKKEESQAPSTWGPNLWPSIGQILWEQSSFNQDGWIEKWFQGIFISTR